MHPAHNKHEVCRVYERAAAVPRPFPAPSARFAAKEAKAAAAVADDACMYMRRLLLPILLFAAAAACAADSPPPPAYTKNVAVIVYEGVEILDFGGPAEVFQAAGGFGRANGQRAFRVYTVGPKADSIISQGFIRITPEFTIENAPKPDIIVIPGGGTGTLLNDAKFMAWAKQAVASADLTLTVCTGAFVLGRLGVLDGLDVTTFYGAIEGLRQATPNARVHEGRRFIDNGKYVTTAGVSAGIDGSLHVVARLLGRVVADQTAQYMEYRWTPESYLTTAYALLNPSLDARGQATQQANLLFNNRKYDAAIEAYRALLATDANDLRVLYNLAQALHSTKKHDEAAAMFERASVVPDLASGAFYNAACAYAAAGKKQQALDALDRAVSAGFRAKQYILEDDDLKELRQDARFVQIVGKL